VGITTRSKKRKSLLSAKGLPVAATSIIGKTRDRLGTVQSNLRPFSGKWPLEERLPDLLRGTLCTFNLVLKEHQE
jgi:hypothetical protein